MPWPSRAGNGGTAGAAYTLPWPGTPLVGRRRKGRASLVAASAVAQREMKSEEANALFKARGCHVINDLDELVPLLKKLGV